MRLLGWLAGSFLGSGNHWSFGGGVGPQVLHPDSLEYFVGIEADDVALMYNLIADQYDILEVVEDDFAGVGPLGDHEEHFSDEVDDLLHQDEILVFWDY